MVAGVNSAGMLFPSLTIMTTGSAVLTTPFQGVVIAPNGSIDLGGSSNLTLVHRGAFFGKTVTLFEKARLFHYRDAYSFRGFGPNNGTPFIMRGVNYPYTWFQSRNTQQDLAAIAATGANTVRVVLSTGGQWARVNGPQVTQIIQWCKDLKMIAVLEVHDSTGWTESTAAVRPVTTMP
jgi:hypothetical protein